MLVVGILPAIAMATAAWLAPRTSQRAREVARTNLALQDEIRTATDHSH